MTEKQNLFEGASSETLLQRLKKLFITIGMYSDRNTTLKSLTSARNKNLLLHVPTLNYQHHRDISIQ